MRLSPCHPARHAEDRCHAQSPPRERAAWTPDCPGACLSANTAPPGEDANVKRETKRTIPQKQVSTPEGRRVRCSDSARGCVVPSRDSQMPGQSSRPVVPGNSCFTGEERSGMSQANEVCLPLAQRDPGASRAWVCSCSPWSPDSGHAAADTLVVT